MNRAIDSATAKQRRIGCVHNRINVKLRDIAAIDLDLTSELRHLSRRQPLDEPTAIALSRVAKAVVQTVRATLPKFHVVRL